MKRYALLTSSIVWLALVTSLAIATVAAQAEPPAYVLKSSAFGGINIVPSVAGNYSVIGANDPNAQQPLSGGAYSVASAHPTLLSRAPTPEMPDNELPNTLFIPAVER